MLRTIKRIIKRTFLYNIITFPLEIGVEMGLVDTSQHGEVSYLKKLIQKDFSLLLVDAEGMDYEVLLLRDNGYVLHRLMGANTIWIRKEFL